MASTRIVEHIGRVLGGRYRLLAPIGTGASAHVFVADDVKLRRRVAVKVLHPALADDEAFLARFRAEARTAAALNHPNVMAVYDWGEEADGPFLVCEFLNGGSLRAILDRGGRLTPSQALVIGLEAARGLDYANRRGLVHRDIKPANLLFDDEGRLRVADFGLARALAEAAWTEPSGAILGTARYASPEQVRGVTLDGKADVYSLALVLFEAVTGRVPFSADTTVGTLLGRLERPIPADPELGPLGPVVARAGRPDPAERLDAVALTSALQSVAADLPDPGPLPLVGLAALDDTLAELGPDPIDMGTPSPTVAFDLPAGLAPTAAPPAASAPPAYAPATTNVPSPPAPGGPEVGPLRAGRRRRRWPWLVLVLVLLAALGGVAYGVVASRVPSHPVPSQVGKREDEAAPALRALKFKVAVKRQYVDGTTAGQVTAQSPAAGRLDEGGTVTLTVSQGPTPVDVPQLARMRRDEAVAALQKVGLAAGKLTTRADEEVPQGQVLDWAPKAVKVPKGGTVDLVVSSGPVPRTVPSVAGSTYDAAAATLGAKGLKVARSDEFNDTIPSGQVIGSRPGAGASVERGSTVTVVVSKGQPVVPALVGLSEADATARLKAAGLDVGGVYGPGGKVFLSNPGAGTKVKSGTKVSLFIL